MTSRWSRMMFSKRSTKGKNHSRNNSRAPKNSILEQINTLNVIQHNVLSWNKHKFALYNTYRHLDPHIILLNSHGCKSDQEIKMFIYNTIKVNKTNTLHDGAAIAVRRDIKYKRMERSVRRPSPSPSIVGCGHRGF